MLVWSLNCVGIVGRESGEDRKDRLSREWEDGDCGIQGEDEDVGDGCFVEGEGRDDLRR
jgi:hypothetical protein